MTTMNMNTFAIRTVEQFAMYISLVKKNYGADWASQAQAEFLSMAPTYGSIQAAADVQTMVRNGLLA